MRISDWSSDVCSSDLALGGAVGFAGVGLPFVETGIALSIVVIGGALALGLSLPAIAAMALVGAFAVFHGHAHGAEMPVAASGLAYGLGFLLATALLPGSGLALGFGLQQADRSDERRLWKEGVSPCRSRGY